MTSSPQWARAVDFLLTEEEPFGSLLAEGTFPPGMGPATGRAGVPARDTRPARPLRLVVTARRVGRLLNAGSYLFFHGPTFNHVLPSGLGGVVTPFFISADLL